MRWSDYTPLFALIIVIVAMIGILVLAILRLDPPAFIVTAATLALGSLFVGSSVRGTQPPNDGGK